ncbi:hypothetical protein PN416_16195 [Halorubrum ezzemoulense]|uniref:hypothetical protein n=1 Tax=Halorubrum ezzemoulense TaxID=337243 RepID=UPI00233101F4|nr:hypothetical protein [Halorubrum ezzemoulense]MDB2242734.1 hypothetical protein [Halorubrum ezzemoulense]MDB9281021.1 hypothetical protein [Halorubrum ezzemoulense]MDB9284943.1 hypothetical protein [Halorubrum ezzemoulense]
MDPEIENLHLVGGVLRETLDQLTLVFEPNVIIVTLRLPDSRECFTHRRPSPLESFPI